MTDQPHLEQPLTPTDITDGIRRELATIRRHWAHTFDPPRSTGSGGSHAVPDSRFPGNDTAISLRAEITRDLAFWVHAYVDDHPDSLDGWVTIDALDVERTCRFLAQQGEHLGAWDSGNRLWAELTTLARELRDIAAPKVRDTIPLGECDCGTIVRAKAHDPGNIKCRGCGTIDTIDGWTLRIVGHHEPVTIPQLVPLLHQRMGIVISERQLRRWHQAGRITATTTGPTPRFDRRDVFAALAYLEHRQREGA
ncbi:hypothetical protein GCM10009740_31560 [Terrabacter terrae]|uniref:Uncharacterized protein n=1 Tax=Terrabacter terrae TaxID=318434 RepID=A0ABP5FZX2_9MICO